MIRDNELFSTILKRNELRIVFKNKLSCNLWGKNWGSISSYFRCDEFKEKCNSVSLDMSGCYWADPIALLSILLELVYIKRDNFKFVKIALPRLGSNDPKSLSFKKGQFLKFLASQGFMKIMLDNFYVYDLREKLTDVRIEKYSNYNYQLLYEGAEIVQAKIYDLDASSKDIIMNKVEEELMFRLKNTVSLQTFYLLAAQIYNIVTELIENVEQHAYTADERKRFGLYIRRRYGAVKNNGKDVQDIESYWDIVNREKANCPALDTQALLEHEAVLEIFFVDIGIGMKGSLQEYYKTWVKRKYKYPIRELFCKVLKDGMRKASSEALTPYGGLHFICRVLRESDGYIWCNEGKEWVGCNSGDLLSPNGESIQVALTENDGNKQNRGLSWCFRVPFSDMSQKSNAIAVTWDNKPNQHPVFKAYQVLDRTLQVEHTLCIDDRNEKCIFMNGDPEKWIDLCSQREFIHELCGRVNTFLWFPKEGNTKNEVIQQLKMKLDEIIVKAVRVFDDINIVIGEVDTNELINYYYALNRISLNTLGYSNIGRISVITKTWGVICFESRTSILVNNRDIARSFFEYNNSNGNKIYNSIGEYARFIRKYDSFLFWEYIRQHQEEKIFINAVIQWNKNMTIRGYINFERLYLFEYLYNLLKNALLRTSGFANNMEIEYRNIDYAALRICQDINTNNIYNDIKSICLINVGGACATGYTRESFYKENKVDINIVFFAHECFDKKIVDTGFLFIWPEEKFFSEFDEDTALYYRLGKTNLISRNSQEMLIDTERVYRNSTRNKKETYMDFQQKYPKFIKYGHYKTDRHHYLIGFDMITYIKYSFIKKQGAFVFLLWKLIDYLSNGNREEIYESIIEKEWKEALRNYNGGSNSDHGELVVYHSNTFTEYVVKLIKEILPRNLLSRIIPINIIEIQQKGTPITFSPFTSDFLKRCFSNNEIEGILYMDSSFSTGRKMMEIENILLSSGCSRVSFLSILDMRRLRNEDVKNNSYWKINVPRLDGDSQCIICSTLKLLENFSTKVDQEANIRIQEWIANWKCLSIVNTVSGHGIEEVRNIQYNLEGIPINDSNALNIYIAEKLCESYSNDYVYQFIIGKTDLSVNLKLQLICTQLCLYGTQNSRQLQLSLLSELVGNMAKTRQISAYTSLGGLVLISQPPMLIYELLNEILYDNTNSRVLSIKKYLLNSENLDLIIAMSYFVKSSYLVEQLLNGYNKKMCSDSDLISSVNLHLLPEKDLKLLSREFEGLLINEQGRRHNTNIQKLIMDHVTDSKTFIERCQSARNDIYRLRELSRHFPIALANSRGAAGAFVNDINSEIEQVELYMMQDEDKYIKIEKEGNRTQQYFISKELKDSLIKCEEKFEEILNYYFITFSDDIREYFYKIISDFEDKYCKKIKLDVNNNVKSEDTHKWYYWNRGIENEFRYLLENLEHCQQDVECGEKNIKMIVDIRFELNHILIQIKSWSEITADLVKNKFLSKNRLSKEQAVAFDVIFDFNNLKQNDDGDFLLETKMSIPACFQQLKGAD